MAVQSISLEESNSVFTHWIQRWLLATATAGLSGAIGLASASEARAAVTIDFNSGWTMVGDATAPSAGNANLSNARSTEAENFSGTDPLETFSASGGAATNLDDELGFTEGAGELDQTDNVFGFPVAVSEGSGLRNTSFAAVTGDTFSFDWTFLTDDSAVDGTGDYAFVEIRNSSDVAVLPLDPNNPFAGVTVSSLSASSDPNFSQEATGAFSYTFTTTDNFDVVVGIVDVGSTSTSSGLGITNAELTPVPLEFSPGTGLLAIGGLIGVLRWRKHRRSRSQSS